MHLEHVKNVWLLKRIDNYVKFNNLNKLNRKNSNFNENM